MLDQQQASEGGLIKDQRGVFEPFACGFAWAVLHARYHGVDYWGITEMPIGIFLGLQTQGDDEILERIGRGRLIGNEASGLGLETCPCLQVTSL